MEKLKYIKIEHDDGTLSENVPIGADAANIDVAGDTTLDVKLNSLTQRQGEQQVSLNRLSSQVSGLASGSPLVANTMSDMTDTSKVYVLTTNGHWYYHNNVWIDGGVYQATVDDGSVNYNQLEDGLKFFINLPLQLGYYPAANFAKNNYTCHTTNTYPLVEGEEYIITFTDKNYSIAWNIYSLDGTFIYQQQWTTYGNVLTGLPSCGLRLMFKRVDEEELTLEDFKNICNNTTINGKKILSQINENTLKEINYSNLDTVLQEGIKKGYFANQESFKGLPTFVEMFVNTNNQMEIVLEDQYDNKTTWNFVSHEKISFTLKKGAQCKAIYYDDDENYLGWDPYWTQATSEDKEVTMVFPQKGRISFANLIKRSQNRKFRGLFIYWYFYAFSIRRFRTWNWSNL